MAVSKSIPCSTVVEMFVNVKVWHLFASVQCLFVLNHTFLHLRECVFATYLFMIEIGAYRISGLTMGLLAHELTHRYFATMQKISRSRETVNNNDNLLPGCIRHTCDNAHETRRLLYSEVNFSNNGYGCNDACSRQAPFMVTVKHAGTACREEEGLAEESRYP